MYAYLVCYRCEVIIGGSGGGVGSNAPIHPTIYLHRCAAVSAHSLLLLSLGTVTGERRVDCHLRFSGQCVALSTTGCPVNPPESSYMEGSVG